MGGGGGGQRPFGTFPKIHPIWKRDPSLRNHLLLEVLPNSGLLALAKNDENDIGDYVAIAIDHYHN